MIYAYILGKVQAGTEQEILSLMKNVKHLKKASLTYGVYDVCIEVEAKTMEELDDFILNVVRKIPGIKETVTLIASKTVFAHPEQALSFG
ncbi:MAG TPA: Lrp/AsnC ligand binding domain-containing protein [Candidatus Bathyarchaeia archaeon]|nr:Lrp/AsnC ligand binding domain-containing protein [Candidatus Bathyarchaeia archaeon]